MLRKIIYGAKSLVHNNPALYSVLYGLATFNWDYFRQRCHANKYSSKFGGMWTDRSDFEALKQHKIRAGKIDNKSLEKIEEWQKTGKVVFENAISHKLIDEYLAETTSLKNSDPCPLMVTAAGLKYPTAFTSDIRHNYPSVRIVDDYYHCDSSRALLFHPIVTDFLEQIFERKPILNQSLRFDHGSQQAIHQDTAFVRMNSPMKLAAVWIALEDIQPGSGELAYYPGSHNWEGFLFSSRFKHYDEARDGSDQLSMWYKWIEDEANSRDVKQQRFAPKKGDLFIWHAGLAHGGSEITNHKTTRKSLVGHYCPEGVRPLYHYYKPTQRRLYDAGRFRFSTSYYR